MVTDKGKGCWVQCTMCGEIYHIEDVVPIDKLYITSYCPRCDNTKGLNCGSDKNSIYLYYDNTKDPRWYHYD